MTKKTNKNRKMTKPEPGIPPTTGWWKYLLIFFVFWAAISYFFKLFNENPSVTISYSTFKNQVKTGNVDYITMKENEINGKFKKNFLPPSQAKNDTTKYQYFSTTTPPVYDGELMKILDNNNVTINAESGDNAWVSYLLIMGLPWLLIMGYFFYVRRKMQGQIGNMMGGGSSGIFGVGKSKAKRFKKQKAGVTFNDVAGLESAKQDLERNN